MIKLTLIIYYLKKKFHYDIPKRSRYYDISIQIRQKLQFSFCLQKVFTSLLWPHFSNFLWNKSDKFWSCIKVWLTDSRIVIAFPKKANIWNLTASDFPALSIALKTLSFIRRSAAKRTGKPTSTTKNRTKQQPLSIAVAFSSSWNQWSKTSIDI